jgi:1-acyl-sn-glycerol-3-phosphate acyltransferase
MAPFRLVAIPLWTAACFALWWALGLAGNPLPRRRRMVRAWGRGVLSLLRIRVEWRGERPVTPFVLVTNHLSYLDVPLLASQLDATFVAKREVRSWPLFGPVAHAVGHIFVDRDSPRDAIRASRAMHDVFRAGGGVVLFAEGTSSPGRDVLPLRTALLEWVARDRVPVATAALAWRTDPRDPPAGDALCWWGEMEFLPHLWRVCSLRPCYAFVTFGETVVAADRRDLAARLHHALSERFTPSGHAH